MAWATIRLQFEERPAKHTELHEPLDGGRHLLKFVLGLHDQLQVGDIEHNADIVQVVLEVAVRLDPGPLQAEPLPVQGLVEMQLASLSLSCKLYSTLNNIECNNAFK